MTDLVPRLRYVDQESEFNLCSMAADQIDQLESEVLEQCRINGMGAERELALLSKVERLERDNAKLMAARKPPNATGWVAPKDHYVMHVLFNPYTGEPRDVRDVQSDPQGILIVPPGKVEMLAVPPAQTLLNDVAVEACIKAVDDAFAYYVDGGKQNGRLLYQYEYIFDLVVDKVMCKPLFTAAPKVQTPMTVDQIDDLAESGCFLRNIYEIVREVELAHGIKD